MQDFYKKYLLEYTTISQKLNDPVITADYRELARLTIRYKELREIKEKLEKIERIEKILKKNQELIEEAEFDKEEELVLIAKKENSELTDKLQTLKKELENLTIPKDPDDARNVILEIRAGAGGDEAGIFAADLFRMYSRYAEEKRYKLTLYNSNKNDVGGIKEIIAHLQGEAVYGDLKHESGVHRVQRIPETEKNGRIHTSTATVAVLPEAEETDIEIKPEEIKIDTFRSSGPGGQSVNTTDSAVRITHLPTGTVVTCQDEKSQHKNRAKALSILRSRLLLLKRETEQEKASQLRSSQIGTGDRSEKIRTYNFPQDRVTDHRIKKSWHNVEEIMNGKIGELINSLKEFELNLKIKSVR